MVQNSTSPFLVTEHVINGQHIREYANAMRTPNASPKLVLKQYTPIDNPNPQPGDITIIGAHGCGFPKELYEPLWEDLYARSQIDGYRIRSIWIADVVNLGASGIRNEESLGNDPSWFDHSRDLLHMINTFRDQMPQPIVGVGHSMGAGQLVLLSLLHPRLFTSLSLIEPVISPDIFAGQGPILAIMSLKRNDKWSSKAEAIKAARKTYKKWDKRVLDLWIENGYRELPTTSEPNLDEQSDRPVTLASSKYQEVLQYLRPNFSDFKPVSQYDSEIDETSSSSSSHHDHDHLLHPDIIGPSHAISPFYRYEPILAWKMLKHIRSAILYLHGDTSPISQPEIREKMLHRTGTGIGGNGGVRESRVQQRVLKGSHQLPLERVKETASAVGPWIGQSVLSWREDEERIAEGWVERSIGDRLKGMDGWVGVLQGLYKADSQKRDSRI